MNFNKSSRKDEYRLSLRNILIAVLIILFFSGIILVYYRMLFNEKRNNIIKNGEMTAKESADQIDRYLSTNIDSVKLAAYTLDKMITEHRTDEEIQDYLVGQSTAVRSAVYENLTGLYGYINGRFFSGTNWVPPEGYDATIRPWYTKPMEKPGEITILDPYVDVQSGNVMLALGKTLCDGVSVISVDVSLEQIQKLTEEAVSSGNSDIQMILNDKGLVVAHSDQNEIGRNYYEENNTIGSEIAGRLNGSDRYFEFVYQGANYIVYVADIQNGWFCISVMDATDVFSSLNSLMLATIIVVIAIVFIISMVMTRSNRYLHTSIQAVAENEAKSAFLAKVSHEIRTPLNAMLGMNEMILRESNEEAIRTYSQSIRTAGKNLLGLVNDILDFSGIEHTEDKQNGEDSGFNIEKFTAPDAHILVVDDNPMNLMVFKNLIKQTGVIVDTADSGDEGIRLTKDTGYDMIFLDHMMPEKDGIETLHEIRGNTENPNKTTPAICLTANAISGARERYLSEGFDDYLTKPIDPDRLEDVMLTYLPEELIKRGVDGEERETGTDSNISGVLKALNGSAINTDIGLKNSGTEGSYLELLKVFYEFIDDKAEELNRLYEENDLGNYTIKVHALKSSARIIGAGDFGEEAQRLEEAGKAGDVDYIRSHHGAFIAEFIKFRELLSGVFSEYETEEEKQEADAELMSIVLNEIKNAAEDMDCERLDTIFAEMKDYRIPEENRELFEALKEAAEKYEYKTILKLMGQE